MPDSADVACMHPVRGAHHDDNRMLTEACCFDCGAVFGLITDESLDRMSDDQANEWARSMGLRRLRR